VYVESEAVTLSRSVPGVVANMVTYFTSNFPRESLESTLAKTRAATGSPLSSASPSKSGSARSDDRKR